MPANIPVFHKKVRSCNQGKRKLSRSWRLSSSAFAGTGWVTHPVGMGFGAQAWAELLTFPHTTDSRQILGHNQMPVTEGEVRSS